MPWGRRVPSAPRGQPSAPRARACTWNRSSSGYARRTTGRCAAFPARLGGQEPFRDLVNAMEGALDLRHHRPGTLPTLAPYLHERTAGRIGSLIRQAVITALTDGTERITKTTLEAVRLDHLAEQHYRPHPRPRPRPRPRSTNTS